jgi:predicted transposase YbfD/YdcC
VQIAVAVCHCKPVSDLDARGYGDIEDLLQIDREQRDKIEHNVSEKVAMQICSRLPKNQAEVETMIQTGWSLAEKMSWDMVVKNYMLPSLANASDNKTRNTVRAGR